VQHDRYDYTLPSTVPLPREKAPMPPLVHALIRLAILYAVIYAVCFGVEGAMRLKYGVGSVTAIEKQYPDRLQRSKALVARQKRIDLITNDPVYDVYLTIVLFGTPFAMVWIIVHDIRLANRVMHRVWKPLRWWAIGMFIILGGGLTIFLGPFMKAQRFYDRVSPAEVIQWLRR
jgi:hypothetical protein